MISLQNTEITIEQFPLQMQAPRLTHPSRPLFRPKRTPGVDYEQAVREWEAELARRLVLAGHVPKVPKALNRDKKHRLTLSHEEYNKPVDNCSVCLDSLSRSCCVTTNCMHSYCKSCLKKWEKNTCPMCRQTVTSTTTWVLTKKKSRFCVM